MPELTIVRKYIAEVGRAIPAGIEVDGELVGFSDFIKLRVGLGKLPCKVEAPWTSGDGKENPKYIDSVFTIDSTTGVICAESATIKDTARIGLGTILHAETTVAQSIIGPGCELERRVFVSGSKLGRGCLIGAGAVLQERTLGDFTAIEHGRIIEAPDQPPKLDRDLSHLDIRGDDPLRLP